MNSIEQARLDPLYAAMLRALQSGSSRPIPTRVIIYPKGVIPYSAPISSVLMA